MYMRPEQGQSDEKCQNVLKSYHWDRNAEKKFKPVPIIKINKQCINCIHVFILNQCSAQDI